MTKQQKALINWLAVAITAMIVVILAITLKATPQSAEIDRRVCVHYEVTDTRIYGHIHTVSMDFDVTKRPTNEHHDLELSVDGRTVYWIDRQNPRYVPGWNKLKAMGCATAVFRFIQFSGVDLKEMEVCY